MKLYWCSWCRFDILQLHIITSANQQVNSWLSRNSVGLSVSSGTQPIRLSCANTPKNWCCALLDKARPSRNSLWILQKKKDDRNCKKHWRRTKRNRFSTLLKYNRVSKLHLVTFIKVLYNNRLRHHKDNPLFLFHFIDVAHTICIRYHSYFKYYYHLQLYHRYNSTYMKKHTP